MGRADLPEWAPVLWDPRGPVGTVGSVRWSVARAAGIGRPVRWTVGAVLAAVGVAVAVTGGSVMTGLAVVDGDPVGALARFIGSLLLGAYYLYLFHLARGRRFFAP
ncbi:MAG: hypothetical protein ACFCVK_13170 [Acidimicrobiales bacterium]